MNLAADYGAWCLACAELLGDLDAWQREQIWGLNAVQWYGLHLE
jgi:hypothetical protein